MATTMRPSVDATTHKPTTERRRSAMPIDTIVSGVLGGGMLGVGFGPLGAMGGMLLGGAAGYLTERHLQRRLERAGNRASA